MRGSNGGSQLAKSKRDCSTCKSTLAASLKRPEEFATRVFVPLKLETAFPTRTFYRQNALVQNTNYPHLLCFYLEERNGATAQMLKLFARGIVTNKT